MEVDSIASSRYNDINIHSSRSKTLSLGVYFTLRLELELYNAACSRAYPSIFTFLLQLLVLLSLLDTGRSLVRPPLTASRTSFAVSEAVLMEERNRGVNSYRELAEHEAGEWVP